MYLILNDLPAYGFGCFFLGNSRWNSIYKVLAGICPTECMFICWKPSYPSRNFPINHCSRQCYQFVYGPTFICSALKEETTTKCTFVVNKSYPQYFLCLLYICYIFVIFVRPLPALMYQGLPWLNGNQINMKGNFFNIKGNQSNTKSNFFNI